MLLLANGAQIFVLLETPLDSFLRKEDVHERRAATPQLLRRGEALRWTLLPFAVLTFAVTLAVLLVRPGGARRLFRSAAWTLPPLAALGALPAITPLLLFWAECVGTSRILATVHPLASNQKQPQSPESRGRAAEGGHRPQHSGRTARALSSDDDERSSSSLPEKQGGIEKPSPWLLCRYLMATASSRLFTKSLLTRAKTSWKLRSAKRKSSSSFFSSDALLSIPPAQAHLLEKLGVVTALALVDDELACEPFSTPQQLLVPSAEGGFSLLDICPVFEGDACSTDDEDTATDRHPPGSYQLSSNDDSDDDSHDVEARFNHSFYAPARALRKMRHYNNRRKKYLGAVGRQMQQGGAARAATGDDRSDNNSGEDDVEVQFEDPQWWKHL